MLLKLGQATTPKPQQDISERLEFGCMQWPIAAPVPEIRCFVYFSTIIIITQRIMKAGPFYKINA